MNNYPYENREALLRTRILEMEELKNNTPDDVDAMSHVASKTGINYSFIDYHSRMGRIRKWCAEGRAFVSESEVRAFYQSWVASNKA
jgi:hypothetical protein